MDFKIPRILIAGLSGDSGKTLVSLSLTRALIRRGFAISVFKKGPDYIDVAWLGKVAHTVGRNLDTYLVEPSIVLESFVRHAENSDIAVIEGNRGIFDGKDINGTHSTAELAKLLQVPVLLCVATSKTTRTMAALVQGCVAFDPKLEIAGVILNKIAGGRHESILRDSISQYCNLPILGAIPAFQQEIIPARHLGLIPPCEFQTPLEKTLEEFGEKYLDIEAIIRVAKNAPTLYTDCSLQKAAIVPKVKIGYFWDAAFSFYYPENLEALCVNGAELIPISALECPCLPIINALYIGGGFPETHANKLMQNHTFVQSVKRAADDGMPIYAECGGLIYLANSLTWQGQHYSMARVFPIDLQMNSKPIGHGYTLLEVDRPNPFFEPGTIIRGHEFHYSGAIEREFPESCCRVITGVGLGKKRDGLVYKNTFATYTHIHASGLTQWATSLVDNAVKRSV